MGGEADMICVEIVPTKNCMNSLNIDSLDLWKQTKLPSLLRDIYKEKYYFDTVNL